MLGRRVNTDIPPVSGIDDFQQPVAPLFSDPSFAPPMMPPIMPPIAEPVPAADSAAEDDFPFSDETIDEIEEYAKACMKGARDYVKKKEPMWELERWIYESKLTRQELEEYAKAGGLDTSKARKSLDEAVDLVQKDGWRSTYVYSPAYTIDSWADHAYQLIFAGAQWLAVIPQSQRGTVEEYQVDTAKALAKLLTYQLEQSKVHSRVYECLAHLPKFGSTMVKCSWWTKEKRQYFTHPDIEGMVEDTVSVYDIPIVNLVPLDKCLPDWQATNSDVQSWRFVGNWVRRTYAEIDADIEAGIYDLNIEEFRERFKDSGGGEGGEYNDTTYYGLTEDPDATGVESDKDVTLRVWELHGQAPTTEAGLVENVVTVVSHDTDDPEDGIMIRLLHGYMLDINMRPYAAAHYSPRESCFGVGQIENNLPLLHFISLFACQLQDNTRLINAGWIVDEQSETAEKMRDNNNRLEPSQVHLKKRGRDDPIKGMQLATFPSGDIHAERNFLISQYERRTNSPDIYRGLSQHEKTATEARTLQQSAETPTQTRVDMIARNLISDMGKICLGMIQQFSDNEDQTIWVPAPGGQHDVPMTITADQISSGMYDVKAMLVRQDQQEMAKAQSIERVFDKAPLLKQMMNQEGWDLSVTELAKRWTELLGMEDTDKFITQLPPQPPMQAMPNEQDLEGMPPGLVPPQFGPNASVPEVTAPTNGGPLGDRSDLDALAQQAQLQSAAGNEQVQ